MANVAKILKAAKTNPAAITFAELQRLVLAAGFVLARTAGSHFVYKRAGTQEIVDIQPRGKDAKPYQVRQVVDLIQKYEIAIH